VGAVHKGEFGDDKHSVSARVDIAVSKAPILSSLGKVEPFIKGGEQTTAYKTVGALLLDGRLHCTGTLIGDKTVLTAAHCLHGYEKQKDKMTFVIGANLLQPTTGPVRISDMAYPTVASTGYLFNPKTLEDDIGLIYLDASVPIKPFGLHKGSPTWDEILNKQVNLIFVGFGYDVIEDQKVGAGIKREAAWWINGVQNRRVTFHVDGRNTCKGDSGGPAFLKLGGVLVQVAVTSGGDGDCATGFDTRIDTFLPWLDGKVK
jgi:secreted trypsin-like serine protease